MKHIVFLLPGSAWKPIGGLKVVYEYANRMVNDGYAVTITYAASFFFSSCSFKKKIRSLVKYVYFAVSRKYTCRAWFDLDNRIREEWVWSLSERQVPGADIYFATAVETSYYLDRYKMVDRVNKYYLIQHFENWSYSDRFVLDSYHLNLKKIVISGWLQDIMKQEQETCVLIRNGFDPAYFISYKPVEDRDKFHISMLYHEAEWKGCEDAFEALEIVKRKYPQLMVSLFGGFPEPQLPDWMTYYRKPDRTLHNRIYNESSIYIGASHSEGFGLTVGEAMLCGCAVACTDNKGYLEMAKDSETALVSPVKKPNELADNIMRLIENDELRYRIAGNACTYISQFTWDESYNRLKELLRSF